MATNKTPSFAKRLLQWFDRHGRKDLPWQQDINAYRVWISEIMLQQTQVSTVIPYFQRFMDSFPTIEALAAAPLDTVLHHWSGLGYYARARNLHKTASIVVENHDGQLPASVDDLGALPGIGRSTAGAICAIAFRQRTPILDGNVKRVLARYHAVEGWPGRSDVNRTLWDYAEQYTPDKRVNDYTQAIMDLGATLCLRGKPLCAQCPLQENCQGFRQGNPQDYPGKKPKKTLPVKAVQMLLIEQPGGGILLEQRPPQGIWGGLWSFPEIEPQGSPEEWSETVLGLTPLSVQTTSSYRHTFSHFHLDITAVHVRLETAPAQVMEAGRRLWYNTRKPPAVGLAAPVSKLLAQLRNNKTTQEVSND